jgi:hypothetical protein
MLGKAYIPEFTKVIPMVDDDGVAWNIKIGTDGKWSNMGAAVSSSITPALPGEKTMAGDQDDVILLADKRYAVTSTGAAKTAGNIADMFSLKREAFCRWTNPTTAAPIILEIDFGAKPIQYMETLGLNFGWGETPKNIKVERVISSGGAYAQLANITSRISGLNNKNTQGKINPNIFASI